MPFDPEQLSQFPTLAGVYLMKNHEGKILYIGKAKNLRGRLKQYFAPGRDTRAIIPYLISQIESIETIIVSSEKEALLLENNLIKSHQPKYNAHLKDDKTFFSLAINHKHRWPMIRVIRYKGKPPSGALYFGPYAHGHSARATLELLRTLFPLRQCSDRELISRKRPCILYDLKRCIAPCVDKCTKQEYDVLVEQVILFLKGRNREIIKKIENEMKEAVEKLEFEKAARLYEILHHIRVTLEKQSVEKTSSFNRDVLGLFREGALVVITQMEFREGKLVASNDRLFPQVAQTDEEILSSFLLQHYEKELSPKEVLIPFTFSEMKSVAELLSTTLLVPRRGEKKALVELANTNAKKYLERAKKEKISPDQILLTVEETFHLLNFPEKIECFDHSHLSGSEPVASMIVYLHGEKAPSLYRKFKIRSNALADDYTALKEVLSRRFIRAKQEDNLPDLIMIDGGKGHLNLALEVLSSLDISTVDVVAIAKEEGRHTKGMTAERVFISGSKDPIFLEERSPLLHFLQQIRDEAHRFAITFQRLRRGKKSFESVLDDIPGIGPVKKTRLLKHFGSLKRILEATREELSQIQGLTKKDISILLQKKDNP